ncbi:MAG: NAD(P)/FAD-dependent oxidoreductase [Candidatus Methanogaster sp.]|uniref:NAD(P)/FAD-dependent oxidoreductase n=1 Tax=Candidatus Methanogaster sp. TaxID=3386292 RepID=A0AC61L707_9EURY|nr:MAG: NAD(P)/FAD-dependent oxidoreductase [ANME-2 cluster archaeon]
MDYDVVVVGAGPAGCLAAKYAAKNGAKTLIIEEHASIGSPVQCAGLLSTSAIGECEVVLDSGFHPIKGAFVYAPDRRRIRISGGEIKAYVVDRRIFDRTLAENAVRSGADILMRTRAVGIDIEMETRGHGHGRRRILHVAIEGEPDVIEAGVVIGADGVQSRIAQWAGLDTPETILSGAQISTVYDFDDLEFVEIFMGSCAPGFFAWAIPYHGSARIGLAVRPGFGSRSAWAHLKRLIAEHPVVSGKCDSGIAGIVLGGIPISVPQQTAAEGLLIVGDAAGQVKPTSGGGVYPGAVCAKIAGKIAADAVLEGNTSARRLSEYDKLWRTRIGRELVIGRRINEWMARLSDSEINRLVGVLDDDELLDLITRYGDMDHPSVVVRKLLMNRKSMGAFLKMALMR